MYVLTFNNQARKIIATVSIIYNDILSFVLGISSVLGN